MDPLIALVVLSWVAIVVLYLGLAAVLREVRMLRREVATATTSWDPREVDEVVTMPGLARSGGPTLVLAADSSCPMCRLHTARLAEQHAHLDAPALVLGYQTREEWGELDDRLRYVQDEDAWQQIAHLSPPVLLLLDESGAAREVTMPSSRDEALVLMQQWGVARSSAR